ncbi:hypothetical protein [Maribacter sp. 2308TA10-17]|uniref:hypothetical protein n=1 Tax=Maribacter sp. 2308TA10-17 TaxID=3386276 RepID=UPI0039BD7CB1
MVLKRELQVILDQEEKSDSELTRCEMVEELIPKYGWSAVQQCLINFMIDKKISSSTIELITQVFWGACLDARDIETDRVIAVLYSRLPKDEKGNENNLIWSIVCKLKRINYLSDYDPLKDLGVLEELNKLDF